MRSHIGTSNTWRVLWRSGALALGLACCAALIWTGPPASSGAAAPPARPPAQAVQPQMAIGLGRMFDAPRAPLSAVLYDQYDAPGHTGVSSQQFEPAYAAFSAQAADDFIVPSGQTWAVNQVDVAGGYYNGPGPADSVNVFFYADVPTPNGPRPGTAVFTQTGIPYVPGAGYGDLIIPLNTPAHLSPGTYWVSVQAVLTFTTRGQWYWRDRAAIQTNNAATWRNPGGGFFPGHCLEWVLRPDCEGNFPERDQVFRLSGAVNGTPLPTATGLAVTSTPVPLPPTATGTPVMPWPLLTQPPPIPTGTPAPTCGPYWREVPGANSGSGNNDLGPLAVVGPSDIWALGSVSDNGGPAQTLLEHWNGAGWAVIPSPSILPYANYLTGIAAASANDVWAVGSYYNGAIYRTLILHWNGSAWSLVPSPNVGPFGSHLTAVTVLSATDAWAVGDYFADASYSSLQAVTMHWDGIHWTVVPVPTGPATGALMGVSAAGPADIWAVGAAVYGYQYTTLTLHWDGARWNLVASPNTGPTGDSLAAVAVVAPNDVWAVGEYEDYSQFHRSFSEHWDGTGWTVVSTEPNAQVNNNYLVSIAAAGPGEVWAAGYYVDVPGITHTRVERWDGTRWAVVPSVEHTPLNSYLAGIAVRGPGDVWAAGGFFNGRDRVLIEHYNDPCVVPSPTPPVTGTPGSPPPSPTRAPTRPPSHTPTPGPSPTPCVVPFGDVEDYQYFYVPIEYLACHGIVSGYADGTFRPYSATTRSQMVKIATRAFAVPAYTPPAGAYTFADVPPPFPFFAFIEAAVHAHMISGYDCGSLSEPCDAQNRRYFRPYAAVGRGQLAKMVVGAAAWPLVNPPVGTFADVAPGTAYYTFVETAFCHAALSGYNCGGNREPCDPNNRPYFRAGNTAIRSQIATIVYGALSNISGGCVRRVPKQN